MTSSDGFDRDNLFFCLPGEEAFSLIRRSVTGGISHTFNKIILAGYTKINEHITGPNAKIAQSIHALDFNALYMSMIGFSKHCMGYCTIRKRENRFRLDNIMGKPKKSIIWLLFEARVKRQAYVCTTLSMGGEKCIVVKGKRWFLDGYEHDAKHAYSFEECKVHGCKT